MRSVGRCLTWATAALGGLVFGETASAQPVARPAGVHRMEIFSGTQRTIRYFPSALSPGDSSSLRALERAENDWAYVEDLQALKAQYVAGERVLNVQRQLVQQDLYGRAITSTGYSNVFLDGLGYGGLGYGTYRPISFGYPFNYGGTYAPLGGGSTTVTRSLAFGMGEEGVIKDALAQVLARQATPEYAAAVEQGLDVAYTRSAESSTLRAALRLPDRGRNPEAFASGEQAPIVLTLKGGKRVLGRELTETKDWFTLTTLDGRRVRIRPSEVTQIDEGKSVRPAG